MWYRNKKKLEERIQALELELEILKEDNTQLKQEKKSIQNFVELLPQGIWKTDTKGRFIFMNNETLKIFGYTQQDISNGLYVTDMIIPSEKERAKSNFKKRFESMFSKSNEYNCITKDGNEFPVLIYSHPLIENGKITGMVGVSVDISREKKIQESLILSEQRLTSIFDCIREPVYITDIDTYEVLWVNKYFAEILNDNPIGEKCYEAFQGIDNICSYCTNDIIKCNNGEPYTWQHYNHKLKKFYQITDQLIDWPDGRKVRFEIAVDITKIEKERRFQNATSDISRMLLEGVKNERYS